MPKLIFSCSYSPLEVDLQISVAWSYQVPLHVLCCSEYSLSVMVEPSSLVLQNKPRHSYLVGTCIRSFLQVNFNCMIRNISYFSKHINNGELLCTKTYVTQSCNYLSQCNIYPYLVYIR